MIIAMVVFLIFWAVAFTKLDSKEFNGGAEVVGAAFCIATISFGIVLFFGMTVSILIGGFAK